VRRTTLLGVDKATVVDDIEIGEEANAVIPRVRPRKAT